VDVYPAGPRKTVIVEASHIGRCGHAVPTEDVRRILTDFACLPFVPPASTAPPDWRPASDSDDVIGDIGRIYGTTSSDDDAARRLPAPEVVPCELRERIATS
jgi:hypothetical protein